MAKNKAERIVLLLCSLVERLLASKSTSESSLSLLFSYRLRCLGCGEKYIGRTERCLQTRLHEYGARNDQPMFRNLTNCEPFNQLVQIHRLADIDKMNCYVYLDAHIFTAVLENYEILDFNSNWSQLCFLEAYYIKLNKPKINDGLKASKELELFK